MKKGIKSLIIVSYISMVCLCLSLLLSRILSHVYVDADVAKRIQSPDNTKIARLIRRKAFIDLNFFVEIKNGLTFRQLHKSRDFSPDKRVDWNEQLIWSYDSSLLYMSVDNQFDNLEKYVWAYDFKHNKEYTTESVIMEIMDSRNSGKDNPVEKRYKW